MRMRWKSRQKLHINKRQHCMSFQCHSTPSTETQIETEMSFSEPNVSFLSKIFNSMIAFLWKPYRDTVSQYISTLNGYSFFPYLPVRQLLHAGHPWDCVLWEANLLRRSLELFLENWLRRVWRGCARQYVQVRSKDFEFSLKSPSKVSLVQWTEGVPGVPLLHFWGALRQAHSLLSSQVTFFNMTVVVCQVPAVVYLFVQMFTWCREVLFDYLKGRWNKEDIQKYIKFSTVVR